MDFKNNLDRQYLAFAENILKEGTISGDRTGTGTKKVFGRMLHHNMNEGFPLLTSKEVHFKSVLTELLWFLSGVTNIKPLVDQKNYIWVGDCYKRYEKYIAESTREEDQTYMLLDKINDIEQTYRAMTRQEFIDMFKSAPNNYEEYTEQDIYSSAEAWKSDFVLKFGELGPVYGSMWTNWDGINQIENAIETLKTNPNSRRILISAWNPKYVDKVVLPPCHYAFQFVTEEIPLYERIEWAIKNIPEEKLPKKEEIIDGENVIIWWSDTTMDKLNVPKHKLNLMFNMRSIDAPLGFPYNIASYGILLMLFAQQTNMIPNELVASLGDLHIYLNQQEGIKKQLTAETFPLPTLTINKAKSIFDYKIEDFKLNNYKSAVKIEMPLSN